jgi:hypothetical protein
MVAETLSPERFASAVAARLQSVVPDRFAVRAQGSAVSVYDQGHWGDWGQSLIADIVAEEDGRSIVERVETAARAIVNFAQDAVMESTREPWPGGPPGGATPTAQVVGEQLHVWFGDEDNPVLRLEPIELAELADGAA